MVEKIGYTIGIVMIAFSCVAIIWFSLIPFNTIKQMIIEYKKKKHGNKGR